MARYTGPSYKQSRRVGFSLTETGKELTKRPYGPGQHGNARHGKPSDYGTQLKKNKNYVLCMVLMKSNLERLLMKLLKCQEYMVLTS